MKSLYTPAFIVFILIILLSVLIPAQGDPFRINETGPRTVQSQDIFLNWTEDIGGGNYKCYQKVYMYKTEGIQWEQICKRSLFLQIASRRFCSDKKNDPSQINLGEVTPLLIHKNISKSDIRPIILFYSFNYFLRDAIFLKDVISLLIYNFS